jgi:hypothetical protein
VALTVANVACGHIHEHAEAIHVAHHVSAEGGQTVVGGRLSLQIAESVLRIMNQLEAADALLVKVVEAPHVSLGSPPVLLYLFCIG